MFFNLISLSYLDTVPVAFTFLSLILLEILKAHGLTNTNGANANSKNSFHQRLIVKEESVDAAKETAENEAEAVTVATATNQSKTSTLNGKLKKQKSSASENHIVCSSPLPTSTSSSCSSGFVSRESFSGASSGSHDELPRPLSIDSLSDEYHEDEDTISLENLFPCDQSELYASKKINFIIDELIQTETNYVNNLRRGVAMYGRLEERQDLPEALRDERRRSELLGNIREILELHEQNILPLMLRHRRDLKQMFDEFAMYFDKNHFYCYVTFTMHKKVSMQLRQENRAWFTDLQEELNDKLGIDSFLVQPIQRLTRYPLLLSQFIAEFYKSNISCKPVLQSVCKLETRMRRLLEVVNQSEEVLLIEELGDFDLLAQGHFRRSTEFDAYQHRSRKKYRAKVFLFDRCLVCVDCRKKRFNYRCHYTWEAIELRLNNSKSVTVALRGRGLAHREAKDELELSAPEAISVKEWMRSARQIFERARQEAAERGKFSLPTDLVMGIVLAIWLMWHYLY